MAGPPYFTDDTEPVELGHVETFLAIQDAWTVDGHAGTAPQFEANFGAIPEVQLNVAVPWAYVQPSGEPAQSGLGDVGCGAKIRLLRETPGRPQVAVYPALVAPTGKADEGLGAGKMQVYLPGWVQKSWGPWTVDAGAGYWFNPGEERRNWVYAGALMVRDFGEWLSLGAEVFHRTPDEDGGGSATGFNAGGELSFTSHHHLVCALGRDLAGPNRLTLYLGWRWTS